MLAKRIIPCLDVKNGQVVKGVRFRDHETVGDIMELAQRYRDAGADELVFYDITASSEARGVDKNWIRKVAQILDIPFCVAGGLRSCAEVSTILANGADKISINSPALERPSLIDELAKAFGNQCVVVGIDSRSEDGDYWAYQYTGDETKTLATRRKTIDWAKEAVDRGAGEIVLNCMDMDGTRDGYDCDQLALLRQAVSVPVIASGGAGEVRHFAEVFQRARVDGALAASIFHKRDVTVGQVKTYLNECKIPVRM